MIRTFNHGLRCLLVLQLAVFALACSDDDNDSGTGGNGNATGGVGATGGNANATGGVGATGGNANATGGVGATGGNANAGMDAGVDAGPDAALMGEMSFFVTSETSNDGDLGGLDDADDLCEELAEDVDADDRTWRAYLSAADDPYNEGNPVNARDRIGQGPWYNANGVLVAANLADLHSRTGDPDIFITEEGDQIDGQWNSAEDIEHDILTGSNPDGTLAIGDNGEPLTCDDWTDDDEDLSVQVGHSDGLGPDMNSNSPFNSWNSAHASNCGDLARTGGAGRFYCFAID